MHAQKTNRLKGRHMVSPVFYISEEVCAKPLKHLSNPD